MNGFILINKPAEWTSFDAVAYIRKIIRTNFPEHKKIKIGHAGTLDPFATGLLIIGIGREATKRIEEFRIMPKTYETIIKLGETSTTDDSTGEITKFKNEIIPTLSQVQTVLNKFTGKQEQVPPMYSAKKIDGTRLYKLARKGEIVERKPSLIEIYSIDLKEYSYPYIKIVVRCSTGTYIRSLARDIGNMLKNGGYCLDLKRTSLGNYKLEEAIDIEKLTSEVIINSFLTA